MNDAIVPENVSVAVATRANFLSEKDGLDLLSQIVNGELDATHSRFAAVMHEPEVRVERSDRLIVSVRHEQVEAIERTFRFVGSKLPIDEAAPGVETQLRPKLPATAGEPQGNVHGHVESGAQPLARAAHMIEVTVFVALGVVIAVLLSPYSPFADAASTLVVFVMPIGVIGVVAQAIAFQRRRSFG